MDPAVIGTLLASSVVAPLVKKLFVREGPGAALVDKPVRLSALIRTLAPNSHVRMT
ncbi:hypothetical protein [Streptomyces sp. NPDC046862]|uniref:NACHT N-terminal Helical domain 1-containing protein n=1 Tax=Streptomyces sp. NPDC046862 TaxID=3154603 RepID=UPI0034545975